MPAERFWWPLDLSPREEEAVERFRRRMIAAPPALDRAAVESVAGLLARRMAGTLADILERDGLPHHCHLINGWGDARFRGRTLFQGTAAFLHRDEDGEPILLQCDPEGDFHPWQSLAYAVMAGVDPDVPIGDSGATLRSLARRSRTIQTGKGQELGHLLFALAHLDPEAGSPPFHFGDALRTVPELVELAVDAHHHGTFEVCRKFHLTEGLCAVAAEIPGMAGLRADAQGFLDGQLDMLLLLGVILAEARGLLEAGKAPQPDDLIEELRETLVMDRYLENHVYYAGHLIELAAFADSFGYRLAPEHRGAVAFVVNELNRTIPACLPKASFLDCFLHFGHYRRAITLLLEVERAHAAGRRLTREDRARFAVDFDALESAPFEPPAAEPVDLDLGVYTLAQPSKPLRPEFAAAVALYAAEAADGLKPRGGFPHFRRIGPPSWPRAFHYELLDYGEEGKDEIGAEIHLESDAVQPLAAAVSGLRDEVARRFPGRRVEWDPEWWRGHGRLRVLFPSASPAEAAAGMRALIDATFAVLDAPASRLLIAADPPCAR
jgi:hypothetical protein